MLAEAVPRCQYWFPFFQRSGAMQFVRFNVMGLIRICLAGIGWADDGGTTNDEKIDHDTARAVLANAKIDIAKAIETAQAEIPTGKPIYASAAKGSKSLRFDVFLWVGDSVTEVKVDAINGTVEETEGNEDDEVENLEVAKKVLTEATKVLAKFKTSFTQAIVTAKGEVEGGRPFKVWTDIKAQGLIGLLRRPIIWVEFLEGDDVAKVGIDARHGWAVFVERRLEIEEEND